MPIADNKNPSGFAAAATAPQRSSRKVALPESPGHECLSVSQPF